MLKITLIAVGKMKESYLAEAQKEYEKRLGAFCQLTVCEVAAAKTGEKESAADRKKAMEEEAERISAKIPPRSYVMAMCIEGKTESSEDLAALLDRLPGEGYSDLCFIIGGSYGLADTVKQEADCRLSMSPMTFPHTLARVMLLEQLYRGFKINGGGTYHK